MVRPPRIEHAGGVFHVVVRGNERALVFRDDRDRERLLEILNEVAERYRWRVLAYCLMGNHFHLLVMTLQPTLARKMRQLNGVCARGSTGVTVGWGICSRGATRRCRCRPTRICVARCAI